MTKEELQWLLIGVVFLVAGIGVVITQSMIFIWMWIAALIITGLGITGVLGSLWAKITGNK